MGARPAERDIGAAAEPPDADGAPAQTSPNIERAVANAEPGGEADDPRSAAADATTPDHEPDDQQ